MVSLAKESLFYKRLFIDSDIVYISDYHCYRR
jgi:hypothetical protein